MTMIDQVAAAEEGKAVLKDAATMMGRKHVSFMSARGTG
jgi:hypothetical protein